MKQAEYLLDKLPCGCMVFDDNSIVAYVNTTLCQMLGFRSEEIVGKSVETILTIASRIFYQTHFFPLLKLQGEVSEIFLTLKSSDDSLIPVMVNANTDVKDSQVTYTCVLATVFERQKYEEQLLAMGKAQQQSLEENRIVRHLTSELEINQHELDRKLSTLNERRQEYVQLSKVLMHDMQEPIRKIALFLDYLLAKKGTNDNVDDSKKLAVVQKSVTRLRNLTSSLLDFVHISSLSEEFTLLSPDELFKQAGEQVREELNFFEFEIITEKLPELEVRPSQLKRVFVELIKNAIFNMDPDKPLTISIAGVLTEENTYQVSPGKYKYTEHVKIEVSDNGKGFDNRHSSYVFGLLNKLNANTPGAGLGLALCKQIVSHHFGTIKCRSQIGKGTTISIVLPLTQSGSHE